MKALVSKSYTFDAAHHITGHSICNVPHGHTFTLTVYVKGLIDKGGFVIDFHDLNKIVKPIIEALDHTYLNYNTLLQIIKAPMTIEVLANFIYLKLKPHFNDKQIDIALQEGKGGIARVGDLV